MPAPCFDQSTRRWLVASGQSTLLWAFICALTILSPSVRGQVLYGSIVGNVTDASEAPVSDAQVTLTNLQTGQVRQTTTGELGNYVFGNVPSGSYRVSITRQSFEGVQKENVNVAINEVVRVNATLKIGTVSEHIRVEATPPALQTDRADVRGELPSRTLVNLPVPPGRNYQLLLSVVPGVGLAQQTNSIAANPARSVNFNANGSPRNGFSVRIDGANMSAVGLPQLSAYIPALESIENVNVVTNSFDAEQGIAGGAAVNVQIKSGTNDLHGVLFEYHNNEHTKAKPYFLPAGERTPKSIMNQFGATIGGPILKDRLFYFASFESTRIRQNSNTFGSLPTADIRNGDMSGSPRLIYDPSTGLADGSGRTPFPGNRVPRDRMDPIAQKLVNLMPLPNLPGLVNNYFASGTFSPNRHTLDAKVNWNPSSRLFVYGRMGLLKYDWESPPIFGDLGGPPVVSTAGFAGRGFGSTYSTSLAATFVATPSLIIDGNFGWAMMDTNSEVVRMNEKVGLDVLGIPGTNGPRSFQGGWPRFVVNNYTVFGLGSANWPIIWNEPSFQYATNANWTKGAHNIRFGGEMAYQALNRVQHELSGSSGSASGAFTFSGGVTTLRNGPAPNQYNSFADLLLGLPSSTNKMLQVPDRLQTRGRAFGLYIRDQWQVNRRLTVTYGARWEYLPIPSRVARGPENFNPATNKMLICGVGAIPRDCGIEVPKKRITPRVGIAWRPTDTFVIRAGYGMNTDPYQLTRQLIANYPELAALDLTGPNTYQPSLPLRTGIPEIVVPNITSGIVDVPNNIAVRTLPLSFPRGYLQSWNVAVQKRLPREYVVQLAYVATRQIRQMGILDLNAGSPGGGNASRPYSRLFGRDTTIGQITSIGNSHYDSLQATLERRFANGYQIAAAYTWSKAMGICCNGDSDGMPAIHLPQYYDLNRAVAPFDRTHNLHVTNILDLPFGKGRRWANQGGLASSVLGGWRVNTILAALSGLPFSVSSAATSLNAPGNTQRADQIKPSVQKLGGLGVGQPYYDPLAFAPVTTARFGTAGFHSLRGPGYINLDLGLFREFRLSERFQLSFRAEVFNLSNTPHFANPDANVSNLQLNPDGSVRALGGFMEVTRIGPTAASRDGVDERLYRFGLRLSF